MNDKRRSRRRGNGEGSIYQLPNGRWRGSVFLGYRDGKPHRKYVTRRTRAEVAAEIRRLLEAQRQGQLVTTGGMTVGEWFATSSNKSPVPSSAHGPSTGTPWISTGIFFRQLAVTASTRCALLTWWRSTTRSRPRACLGAA
jgi:hypothetical protein